MQRVWLLTSCWIFALAFGCAQRPGIEEQKSSQTGQAGPESDHAHGAGSHGGTIADWGGGKYHVEFTVDHDKQQATVYVLADDAKTEAPIAADKLLLSIDEPRFQVELLPGTLDGQPAGSSSRFVGQHESLGKVQEFAGTISAVVDGVPYAADFREQPHGHTHD